jgi:hypothetical protein
MMIGLGCVSEASTFDTAARQGEVHRKQAYVHVLATALDLSD